MKEETYDKIFKDFEEYCKEINWKNQRHCDFDFYNDDRGDFIVYDMEYVDQEEVIEDAINIFKKNGVTPKNVEWVYDCGNEYDDWSRLEIYF